METQEKKVALNLYMVKNQNVLLKLSHRKKKESHFKWIKNALKQKQILTNIIMEYSSFRSEQALSKQYCIYFKIIYLFGIFLMLMVLLGTLYASMTKSMPFEFYLGAFIWFLSYYFVYLQNKLLYDMCQNSLIA